MRKDHLIAKKIYAQMSRREVCNEFFRRRIRTGIHPYGQ